SYHPLHRIRDCTECLVGSELCIRVWFELEHVKKRAEREQRSMASVCRLAVLRELGLNDNEKVTS
ncbi:MAG: hypothetical protein ACT6UU_24325, partial [Hydrogenophaga sp.]|uniref:hypothetical protein n=1 Tax=Hydrogenophaga sp. TaxID=1904254 RepID=UPI004036832C